MDERKLPTRAAKKQSPHRQRITMDRQQPTCMGQDGTGRGGGRTPTKTEKETETEAYRKPGVESDAPQTHTQQ